MTPSPTDLPEELAAALKADAMALAAFDALPDVHRRQHVEFVGNCRTPQARRDRAADVIIMLRTYARGRRLELKQRGPGPWSARS